MRKPIKIVLVVVATMAAFMVAAFIFHPVFAFYRAQVSGILQAGTWEDDPKNWYRAFRAFSEMI